MTLFEFIIGWTWFSIIIGLTFGAAMKGQEIAEFDEKEEE